MTLSIAFVASFVFTFMAGSIVACESLASPGIREVASYNLDFEVAKAVVAPDGSAVALVGSGGTGALVRFREAGVVQTSTGIDRPIWLGYAPDGSELWVRGRKGNFARLDPHSGQPLSGSAAWVTKAGETKISSAIVGKYVLSSHGKRAEAEGRIVTDDEGRLDFDGSVFIAKRPDLLLRFRNGVLTKENKGETKPVGAMAVACGGTCLLTAADAETVDTYLWTLSPFESNPVRIEGRIFLDGGHAALDPGGVHALLVSKNGLRRISLPHNSQPELGSRQNRVMRARLSNKYAFISEEVLGWRVYNASTLDAVSKPLWLDVDQTKAVVGLNGRFSLFANVSGSFTLVATPYSEIRYFDIDLETALPQFSSTDAMLALRGGGGFTLFDSKSGNKLGQIPGEVILFSPDDSHVVSIGERVRVFQTGYK